MQTSETIGGIAGALAKAQGEFKNPEKNREVTVTPKKRKNADGGEWQPAAYKFKYATFDAILEMARPILSKHELALIQTTSSANGTVIVTTRLAHSSGEWIEDSIGAASEGRELQAIGSALSYLKRYALTAMLGVAADEDDDANSADGNLADVKDRGRGSSQGKGRDSPRLAPAEVVGEDWRIWMEDLKKQIISEPDYTSGKAIWSANTKALKALKDSFPKTFDALQDWVKETCESKPKAA